MKATLLKNPTWSLQLLVAALLSACGGSDEVDPLSEPPEPSPGSNGALAYLYHPSPIGDAFAGFPWVTDLEIVDLDGDGRLDVVFCEGRLHQVIWLRQGEDGAFEERLLSDKVRGPAHVKAADMSGDGHLDLLIAGMGIITPNNDPIGSVTILENDGQQNFNAREILSDVARVTYVEAGDLNGDGLLDFSVAQFGYFEGEVRWMENRGDGTFNSHQLLGLEGAIHAPMADLDGDGDLDIVALVSQDWEEVYGFFNDGNGNFERRVLWGSTNKDYGSSGLVVADLNRDGHPDIVFANGDGFDYATPGSRPWHGLQWLENDGSGAFTYHRIGDFLGAYSPVVVDVDGDGHLDVVVASGFNDWSDPDAISLAWFENEGSQNFILRPLARQPTHLVVADAADLNGDGLIELVTGALHFYPPYDKLSRVSLWRQMER